MDILLPTDILNVLIIVKSQEHSKSPNNPAAPTVSRGRINSKNIQFSPVISCLLSSVAYALRRLENMEMGVNPEVNAPTAADGRTSPKKSCLRIPGGIPVGGWGLLCLKIGTNRLKKKSYFKIG